MAWVVGGEEEGRGSPGGRATRTRVRACVGVESVDPGAGREPLQRTQWG